MVKIKNIRLMIFESIMIMGLVLCALFVLGILAIFLLISVLFLSPIHDSHSKVYKVETICYDMHNHEIKGNITCEKEIHCSEKLRWINLDECYNYSQEYIPEVCMKEKGLTKKLVCN